MDDVTLWDKLADAQWHQHEAALKGNDLMAAAWRRQTQVLEALIERNTNATEA